MPPPSNSPRASVSRSRFWYCSGLIVQFQIGKVVVGESRTFRGGIDWLRERGVDVLDLDSPECVDLLTAFIEAHPDVWHEDIGTA